jgi:hypothetical protein
LAHLGSDGNSYLLSHTLCVGPGGEEKVEVKIYNVMCSFHFTFEDDNASNFKAGIRLFNPITKINI